MACRAFHTLNLQWYRILIILPANSMITQLYGAPFVKILYLTDLAQKLLSLHAEMLSLPEIAISARDSSFCAKSVRYNIFTNGSP